MAANEDLLVETMEKVGKTVRGWIPWVHPEMAPTHPALRAIDDDRTLGERVADKVAAFGGSWPFIFCALGFIAAWMVLNTFLIARGLHHKAFDPYPYILLNLLLSCIAGLQAPVIMMSQNRAAARDEALANHHYEETRKIDELLGANTDLTEKVHQLTAQIHEMTAKLDLNLGKDSTAG